MFVPKSPFFQPMPLLVSLFAIAVILNLLFGSGGSNSNNTFNIPASNVYLGQLGSCYKQIDSNGTPQVQMVDCNGGEATLKSVSEVEIASSCPITATYTIQGKRKDDSLFVACLESIQLG